MALLKAYFDESDREASRTIVVAGCLFTMEQAGAFVTDWRQVFGKYGGCHMKDLVAARPPYHALSPDERRGLVRRAVEIMIHRVEHCPMVVANVSDLEDGPACAFGLRKAYGICANRAIEAIEQRLDEQGRYDEVDYQFATGYTKPGARVELRQYLDEWGDLLFRRAHGLGFSKHIPCGPFDACDVAAWEMGRHAQAFATDPQTQMRGSLRLLLDSGKFEWHVETRAALEAYQEAVRLNQEESRRRKATPP